MTTPARHPRVRRRLHPGTPLAGDAGAGTIELIGILTIAALLVSAVVVSVRAMDPGAQTASVLCRIAEALGTGAGCEPSSEDRSAEDYLPPEQCVVSADGGSVNVRAGIVAFGGADGDWLIEQLGDETYRLTRAASLEGGAQVGIGFDVSVTGDGHRYGVGLGAGAGASATLTGGEVYEVATLEDARALLAAKNVETAKDALAGPSGPGRWLTDQVHGALGDTSREHVVPDETYYAAGAGGEASGVLNAFLGGASAQASVEQTLGTRVRRDGSQTVYFRSAAGISGDLQGLSPGEQPGQTGEYAELSGRLEGEYVLEVEYDKDGEPTSLTVRSLYVADGTAEAGHASRADFQDPDVAHEVAMSLPLRTDADREIAMRTLYSAGIPYAPGLSDGFDAADYALARVAPWESIQNFGRAAIESGQLWRQESTTESSDYGVNFDAAYLAKLQLSGGYTSTHQAISSYEYWNGQGFVPRNGCGAGAA